MILEYYSIRIKDAAPGEGLLHSTAHYDEVRSSIKHFKEKHPNKKVVAYKHTLKKGSMGVGHTRKQMFGEDTEMTSITLDETTKSFNTLMRSIQDKKSIKNLKVPLPSERNPDGSMKPKDDEPAKIGISKPIKTNENDSASHHRISVTISNPNHPFITKRAEKIQRIISVKGDKADALAKAKSHYKGKGYKIHGAEYIEGYAKHIDEAEVHSTSSSYTELKHTQDTASGKWEVRGPKYPSARRPRHAIFKDGQYHSMSGTLHDAKGWINQLSTVKEETDMITESRMAELHADIGDHMDKHITNYRKAGGAEALMAHAAKATPKIAKMYGIEHKHAEKFISDYIDSKLNESVDVAEGKDHQIGDHIVFYPSLGQRTARTRTGKIINKTDTHLIVQSGDNTVSEKIHPSQVARNFRLGEEADSVTSGKFSFQRYHIELASVE